MFEGKELVIDKESLNYMFGLGKDLKKMLLLFTQLADSSFEAPSQLPFPDARLPNNAVGFVFFLIDECQVRHL